MSTTAASGHKTLTEWRRIVSSETQTHVTGVEQMRRCLDRELVYPTDIATCCLNYGGVYTPKLSTLIANLIQLQGKFSNVFHIIF